MSQPLRALPHATPLPVAPADLAAHAGEVPPAWAHVTFPWSAMRETAGPMLPGRLYFVSARTGSGKTLFIRSLLEHWLYRDDPMPVAYWPTETTPEEIVRALVAAQYGVHPARIEEGDFSHIPGGEGGFFVACGKFVLRYVSGGGGDRPLWLYGAPRPKRQDIRLALKAFAEAGGRVFVVDHLLRLHLDLRNLFAEASDAVKELKQAAQDFGLVGIVTSQQGRATGGGDRLAWFAPPDLSALKGSGALEEEADGVFFLHRVLKAMAETDVAAIRRGVRPLQDALEPNLMGVAVGKSRVDGSRTHGQCRLWVEHGRVTDLPADAARDESADRHGLLPGRP